MWQELTITGHADRQAFLEATLLAAIAIDADNVAGLILQALFVLDVLLNAAPEETLRKEEEQVKSLSNQSLSERITSQGLGYSEANL